MYTVIFKLLKYPLRDTFMGHILKTPTIVYAWGTMHQGLVKAESLHTGEVKERLNQMELALKAS
jgi:hypothetical protein